MTATRLAPHFRLLIATCVSTGVAGFAWLQIADFGLAIALAVFAGMWLSLSIDIATQKRHKAAEATAAVGIAVFLGMLFTTGILPALIGLLVAAQFALNIRADYNNRVYGAIIIGLVCLLAGAADAKTGNYLWFMASYGLAAAFTLKAVYLQADSDQPIPFKHNIQLASTTLGLALLIYLLMPRLPAGNLGMHAGGSDHFYQNKDWEQQADSGRSEPPPPNEQQGQNTTDSQTNNPSKRAAESSGEGFNYGGFNESFSINNPDPQKSRFSNVLIARVKSDVPLYLKARVFDAFDGHRWSQSQQLLDKKRLERGHFEAQNSTLARTAKAHTKTLEYVVHVEQPMTSNIPFAEQLTELDFPASVIARDAFGQWFAPSRLQQGTIYGAKVQLHTVDKRIFSSLTTKIQGVKGASNDAQKLLDAEHAKVKQQRQQALAQYLTLPTDLDPRIVKLAGSHRTKEGAFPELQTAIALETFLRTQFEYDFESIFNSQNVTPLSEFLFETKKGHCEYFASALAIMLRTLDIPTRLVTGLLAHNQNPLTGYFEVRALDGHAWVEAYVDGRGWVLLEPTAYYPMPETPEHNSNLTAEKIQNYIKELERAEKETGTNQSFSLAGLMRATWYSLTLIVTVALATLKLFVLTLWWLWPILIALAIGGYMVWQKRGGELKNRYLHYRLQKSPELSPEQYLQWLHKALNNLAQFHAPGLSIECFMDAVANSQLTAPQKQQLISLFNGYAYNTQKLNSEQIKTLKTLLAVLLRHTLMPPKAEYK